MASPFLTATLPEQLMLSYLVGSVGGRVLQPSVQFLENDAWKLAAVRPPDAILLALGVAQGQVPHDAAYEWAKQQGFDTPQMDAMVDTANTGPDIGLAYRAWRRNELSDAEFATALKRTGLEDEWVAAMKALKFEVLDLGAIATAVHRGIMQDAGLLVTPVPSGVGNVPRIPVSPMDTLAEFAAQGIDPERARILVADTGLPLSLGEMLQLYNRNKVTATDVKVSIAESNVRNEYMDVALDLSRRLLTPHEYAESELRGILSPADAKNGAGLSGLDPADYDTLFGILGRPLAVHAITTGLARGGTFGGTYSDVPEPYRDAIRRSAIRPEYAVLAHANRYSYPSGFQIRAEAQSGDLSETQTEELLLEMGWKPQWAAFFAKAWTGGSTAIGDKNVAKAQTQLWNTTHRSYVAEETDNPTATAALEAAGIAAASIPAILTLWGHERSLVRKQLTPANIRKALNAGAVNPATGAAWTTAEAHAALLARGYDDADATVFLEL